MALDLIDNNQDDTTKKKDNTQPGQDQSAPSAGIAAPNPNQSSSAGAASNTQGGTSGGAKTGTGFVNLQKVINANQNNQLGSTVGGGITSEANNVKSGLQNSVDTFNTGVNQNEIGSQNDVTSRNNILNKVSNYSSPDVNTIGQGPNASAGNSNTGSSVAPTATNPILSADDIANFNKYKNAQYQGPTALNNYDTLAAQAQNVQDIGSNVNKGASGLQTLLQNYVAKPGYTSGQRSLDAAILGQTGGQDLRNARNATIGLTGNVNTQQSAAQALAAQKAQEATGFATDTQAALGTNVNGNASGAIGSFANDLNARTSSANAQNTQQYNDFMSRLSSGALNVDDAQYLIPLLGGDVSGQNVNNLNTFGLKPSDFATAFQNNGAGQNSVSNIANKTDLAKAQALSQLAGQNDLSSLGIALDPTKSGQMANAISADPSQFTQYQQKNADLTKNSSAARNALAQSQYFQHGSDSAISDLAKQRSALDTSSVDYRKNLAQIYKNAIDSNEFSPDEKQYIVSQLYNPLIGHSMLADSDEARMLNRAPGSLAGQYNAPNQTSNITANGQNGVNEFADAAGLTGSIFGATGAATGLPLGRGGAQLGNQIGQTGANAISNGVASGANFLGVGNVGNSIGSSLGFGGGGGPIMATETPSFYSGSPKDVNAIKAYNTSLGKYASDQFGNVLRGIQGQATTAYQNQLNDVYKNAGTSSDNTLASLIAPAQRDAFAKKYPGMAQMFANGQNGQVNKF